MERYKQLIFLCLALLLPALCWGGDQQTLPTKDSPTVTGNFRDPQSVIKMRNITDAQRKEAARMKAARMAEASKTTKGVKK